MQVTLRVWYDTDRSTDNTPLRCYLWQPGPLGQRGLQLPLAPLGKEAVGATPCSPTSKRPRTLIRVHGHGPAFQIRAWLAFPMAATLSSGYHAPPERAGC